MYLFSHDIDGIVHSRYELVFVNPDDYINESVDIKDDWVEDIKDEIDISLGENSRRFSKTKFDLINQIEMTQFGKYYTVYVPPLMLTFKYTQYHDGLSDEVTDAIAINIEKELSDQDILNILRRMIEKYPDILIYKRGKLKPDLRNRLSPTRIVIVKR